MALNIIMVFGLACYGVYQVAVNYIIYPSRRTKKLYREGGVREKGNWLDMICDPIAARIEPYVLMNDYKKERLGHTLSTIGDAHTATQYQASAIAQALLVALLGIPLAFFYPLLPLVTAIFAVVGYFLIMREPEKRLEEKRRRIELELPRFASTISNSLGTSRDVIKIVENYRKVCGPELSGELDVTLADMKTGNPSTALRNLENRIGSTKLSELVRGLLSVLQGEDQTLYFYTKNVEFRKEYIEYQKQEIQKRPGKLTKFIIMIVVCYLAMLLYIIIYQVMASGGALF